MCSELASPSLKFLGFSRMSFAGAGWKPQTGRLQFRWKRVNLRVMKRILMIPMLGVLALLASSCTPSTPQTRIQERPQEFERLSARHQELVRRGEIEKGMDKVAVSLAWGSPSARAEGFRNGEHTERWDFHGQKAVVSHRPYGGYYPYGYRDYHRGYHHADFGPDIIHVPYRRASVWFVRGRVNEWERLR